MLLTRRQRRKARSDSKLYEYNGETHTLSEWSVILDVTKRTLQYRIHAGLPKAEIFASDRRVTDLKKTDVRKYIRRLEREIEEMDYGQDT